MAAVAGDVTSIQDEELLRRMWQDTEDFGRKKEIRARMYKLREQRLKEFYTTGEVLSDVLTTGSAALDAVKSLSNKHSTQQQVIQKSASYTTSSSGGNFAIAHADSFADEGFMTLKSKEIRDSESPTRDFHRRQQMNQADSQLISQEYQNLSQDGGGDGYWHVTQESSSQDFKSSGKTGADGEMIVNTSSRSEQHNLAGGSDTDGLSCVSQVSETANTARTPVKEAAVKDSAANANTSVVVSEHAGGKTVSSSTSQKWSSSQSSKREERVSSSSTTSSSSRVVHKDSGFSDDFHSKDVSESNIRKDSLTEQGGSRKSSLTTDQGSRKSSLTTPGGKHRITQRSSTTEVPFGDLGVAIDANTTTINTSKSGETMTIDINVASKLEETSSKTEEKSTLDEKRIMSELQKLDTFLSTQKSASTPASPGDAGSWTVVSGQQTGRDTTDKAEEFVFHVGRDQEVTDVTNSSSFIAQEKTSTQDARDKTTRVTDHDTTTKVRELSPEKKPVLATTPTEPKKGIMKQPSQDKMDTTGLYVTTYTEHFTNKRISVETDRNHDAFAKSLRSSCSPEKSTPTSTRSSSKASLDRNSPTRNHRNKTSADSSLASLNRTSPTRKSPSRASPEKSVSPSKSKATPSSDKTSDRTSPSRSTNDKTRQQSPDKKTSSTSPSRVSQPGVRGAPESKSPTRSTSQEKPVRRSSSARNSPEKDSRGPSPDKLSADRNSKGPSRRVSAGDKPRTEASSKISVSATIKEKRRLSSGVSRTATKKRCSTPGASPTVSPTRDERQSRPRSRGSSRSSVESGGSDSESRTYTRDTEEDTRKYQQSVMDKEDSLMTTTSKAINVDQGSVITIDILNLLDQERSPRPTGQGTATERGPSDDNVDVTNNVTIELTVTDVDAQSVNSDSKTKIAVGKGSSPVKNTPKLRESPALSKLSRDRSPEYSSEGSLANELPRRSAAAAPRRDVVDSPVKPLRGGQDSQDSPDSSPERATFTPIKQFRTSPEVRPDDLVESKTHAPKPTNVSPTTAKSPSKPASSKRGVAATDSSDEVGTPTIKEPVKPNKPISTRPDTSRKSPQRPNSSPANPDDAASRPNQKSPVVFKLCKPDRSGDQSPSRRIPSSPSTDKSRSVSARVPEVTRRSPTPESPTRRAGRPSDSSSVSPCSSPERQSDRENNRHRAHPKKSPQKKKPVDSDKNVRGYSPDKSSARDRSSSPEKTPVKSAPKKKPDSSGSPKDTSRRSESPIKATPARRGSLPRRLSKEAMKPQYSDSSPERESPERRTVRPSQKTPSSRGVTTVKVQPSPARPSSIPRAGRKPVIAEVKPLERKPSWSKTLRSEAPRETHKVTKTIVLGRVATVNRSASADSKPRPTTVRPDAQPSRRRPSPTSSPERPAPGRSASARPLRNRPDASPVKSAFVRTNSKPTASPEQKVPKKPEVPRFTTTTKLTPKGGPPKCKCPEDHSTDRSSSLSSPETVRPRDGQPRPEHVTSSSDAEDRPVSLSFVTGVVKTYIKVNTATEDYFSDEYEDVLDETPPEEFLVDDDSPIGLTLKQSSIPTPSKKEPIASSTPVKSSPINKIGTPDSKTFRPATSTPNTGSTRPRSQEPKKVPTKSEPAKIPSKAPQNKPSASKPELPKTFRSVATLDSRITRANSDKNVIRRQSPSPSGVLNRRQASKPELPVSRLADRSVTTRSTARQQVNTVSSVTTRLTAAKATSNKTTTSTASTPKKAPVNKKLAPVDSVKKSSAPLKPTSNGQPKKLNGVSKQPEFGSSSSDDEEGLPDECPSLIDTDDEEYSREMEELRREEESRYASRVTSREDALLSICQDKLKTSRDSLTIVDIRLKSSRESSPDSRGPRYADRVSEPETDDDFTRKPEAVRFQRPVLQPNPLDEETDEDARETNEPKITPKVYPKSILTAAKATPSVLEKLKPSTSQQTPKSDRIPLEYPRGEIDDSQPKRPSEYLQRGPDKRVSDLPEDEDADIVDSKSPRNYPPQKPLQVTDLDASDTEESLRLSVSVSDRVTHFLEAAQTLSSAPTPQTTESPTRLSTLDSPSAVNKARAMFETIATTQQTSPPSPRQKDILSRPSVFEARRNGPWATTQEKTTPKPIDESPKTTTSRPNERPTQPKANDYPSDEEITVQSKITVDISNKSSTITRKSSSPRDDTPTDKSPTNKTTDTFTRRRTSISPERPSSRKDSYPRERSPTEKTDTSSRRKPTLSPERNTNPRDTYPRDKSPPGKTTTNDTRRKPTLSPERNTTPRDTYPRDKSPPGKTATNDTRRKPIMSPERNTTPRDTYPKDKSPPGKTTTNDTRRKPTLSPERERNNTPRDTYPRDKSPPGKTTTNDTFTRRKPSSSPERPSTTTRKDSHPRDKSPPRKISTDTFTRRKSTDRTADYGTYTKPKPQQEQQSPDNVQTTKPYDKYASFPSQTRGSRIKVDEAPDSTTETISMAASPAKSPEDVSSTKRKPSKDDLPDIMDILAIRRGSVPKKDTSTSVRRDSMPIKDTSPVRKDSLPRTPSQDTPRRTSPTRQVKESPKPVDAVSSPPSRKDSSARESSPTRDYTGRTTSPTRKPKETPTRKDSLPKDSKRIVSLETSSTRGSGVFGVALRSATATTSTTSTPRRRSDAKPKPEDEEENIEEIFELELLETMLEKAVGYDKRRRLRAQIRIVRRQLEISTSTDTSTTTKTTTMTASRETNRSTATVELSSRRRESPTSRPSPRVESQPQEEPRKFSTSDSSKPQGRRPSDTVDARRRSPSPQKSVPVELGAGSKPGSNTFVKKHSKTELTIELKASSSPAVKTPAKKWSIGEAPQEACPVTSSYGVGPTDENGRPLFGLRALRKSHNNQSQTDSPEPKPAPVEPEVVPEVVRDRSGRPLFGGLRALQTKTTVDTSSTTTSRRDSTKDTASTTTYRRDSTRDTSSPTTYRRDSTRDTSSPTTSRRDSTKDTSSPTTYRRDSTRDTASPITYRRDSTKDTASTTTSRRDSSRDTASPTTYRRDSSRDTEDEENKMPEQPESPQLRDLVTRHEQRVRGAETSQPLQKPRAKLRDSFILPTTTTTDVGSVATETTRSASHRAQALRSLIQKHESIAKDDELSLGSRPGILKNSESHSRSTVVTSRGTLRSDGTVSLTRDVIKGETVQRSGEEPITRVTRSQQRYDTPTDKPLAIEDVEELTPSSRKSSSAKSSSPERFCGTRDERRFVTSASLSRTSPERSEKLVSNRRSSTETTPKSALGKTPTSARRQIFNDDNEDSEVTNKSTSRYTSSATVTTSKQVSNQYSAGEERRSSQGYVVDYNDDDESDGYQGSSHFVDVSSKTSSPRCTPDRVIPGYNSRETRRRSSTPLEEGQKTPTGSTRTITRGNSIRALQEKFQQAAGSPVSGKQPMSLDSGVATSTTTSSRSQTTTTTDSSSPRSFINNQTRVTGVQDILTRMRNADQVVESGDTIEDSEARALLNKFLGAQVILTGMEQPLLAGSKHGSSLVTQVERQMEPLVRVSQQSAALVRQVERQRVLSTSSSTKLQTSSAASNGREEDVEDIWDEAKLRRLLDDCTDYEGRRKIRARLRVVMAEQKACSEIVSAAIADQAAAAGDAAGAVELRSEQDVSEATTKSSSVEGNTITKTEVTTKTSSFTSTAVGSRVVTKAPIPKAVSPFAKFQQLDRQNSKSAPNSPKTPGEPAAGPLFKFTDPQLCRSASTVKDKLLYWCQVKTKEYKNIKIDNFSTSWSNGLAFCALVHHFLPTAFDYDALKPEERRKNFELAFQIADDKAGIAPLLDVEDMVMMRKPDWKCVFTYVQSIYRRFKDED